MNIEELIKSLAGTLGKDFAVLVSAEVISVNESERTCKIRTIGGDNETEIDDVFLMAESNDGFYRVPKVGSIVKVSLSQNETPIVLVFGEIQKIFIEAELIETNGGEFGGIVKIDPLVEKLNTLEDALNNLIQSYNTHMHSGGTISGNTAVTTAIISATITPTQKTELENTKFKHGS